MSDANKEVIRTAMREVWEGNLRLVAEDYVDHDLPPGLPPGKEGLARLYELTLQGFPDFAVRVEQLVAEGDLVAARVVNSGTNTGPFLGNPASNETAEWQTMAMFRVEDGLVAERWGVVDLAGLRRQLKT